MTPSPPTMAEQSDELDHETVGKWSRWRIATPSAGWPFLTEVARAYLARCAELADMTADYLRRHKDAADHLERAVLAESRATAAEARCAEMGKYTRHKRDCRKERYNSSKMICDCGLAAVLKPGSKT